MKINPLNSIYLTQIFLKITYNKEVRAKGKRSKHLSKQQESEGHYIEMILNENAKKEAILKSALFKLGLKVKPNQKAFLEKVIKVKRLEL